MKHFGEIMNIAYVRVSTVEQNEARQIEALEKYGIERWYTEKISGKDANRPKLQEMQPNRNSPAAKPHLWLSLTLLFLSPFLKPLPGFLCPDQFRAPGPHRPCSGAPLSPASLAREGPLLAP